MATIAPQTKTGLDLAMTMAAAAAGGDQVANARGSVVVVVRNAHATLPRTVTLNSYQSTKLQGVGQLDHAVVVAAGKVALVGPLDKQAWNNPAGRVELAYSDSAADLTVGAYQG